MPLAGAYRDMEQRRRVANLHYRDLRIAASMYSLIPMCPSSISLIRFLRGGFRDHLNCEAYVVLTGRVSPVDIAPFASIHQSGAMQLFHRERDRNAVSG